MSHSRPGEADFDLNRPYGTYIDTVLHLFNQPGEAFLVPLYQREYTWEKDNIDQLFDDLILGILELAGDDGDTATTFLGTTIFVPLKDKSETVWNGEERAQPSQVLSVIDGQQRIATIALLAIRVRAHLERLELQLRGRDEEPHPDLRHHCSDTIRDLTKLYSVKLGRGAMPPHKPKIIQAGEDRWTYVGDDESYQSPVASYLAASIRTDELDGVVARYPEDGGRVRANVERIDTWFAACCECASPNKPPVRPFSDRHDHCFRSGTEGGLRLR